MSITQKEELKTHRKKGLKGRKIGSRYLVERELGRGGAGVVYLAQDSLLEGKKVALKVLEVQEAQFVLLASSLKNEFSTLSLLHHRNLAEVYDFGASEREMYFSSEWVDGQDILRATREANLNTVFQLIVQTLRAVDFLHRRGVLHLDLKPANVLVTDPDRTGKLSAKLIDFGIAQWKRRGQLGPGEFSGTPPYAAPEIMMEKPPTPASDIYSLGIIFHQIFFRRLPFRAEVAFEIMQEQIYKEPLRMVGLNPALPDDFSDLLLKMVARNPSDRYQSSREVLEAINKSLGENFTLRTPTAPIHILEESDYVFRGDLLSELVHFFGEGESQAISLSGPQGIGKSYLLKRVKASSQLKGIYPFFSQDIESLSLIPPDEATRPLPNPLLCKEREYSSSPSLQRRGLGGGPLEIELSPLTEEQILGFFENEIVDFPIALNGKTLMNLSEGLPSRLELILQALREEGILQWTDQGWQWREEVEADFSQLLESQEKRWRERLSRVQEVLKFSQVGLNSKILEGILGLEPGALEEKLKEWESLKFIIKKIEGEAPLYFSNIISTFESINELPRDWGWVENELTALYDRDEYQKGVEWAQLIFSRVSEVEGIPPRVAILCARHYISSGNAKQALKTLPFSSPDEPAMAGLFYEIRARSKFVLGNFQEALGELNEAEKFYTAGTDPIGLAAVFNIRGLISKKVCDYQTAESSFLAAIAKAEGTQAPYITASLQMNLGTLYHDQGRFDLAQSAYQQALALSQHFDHPLLSCIIRHNWINLLFYMGRAHEAEAVCFDLLHRSIRFLYPQQQAAALNYLSLLAGQKNHREQQQAYLNQAIGLLDPDQPNPFLAQMLINRSYAYWDLKKPTPAQLDAEAALSLAEKNSNFALSSLAYLILGKIFRDRPKPDWESASNFFEKSHQMILQNQNRPLLWEINFERGILAKKQKAMSKAKEFFLSAQKDLETMISDMPEQHRESYLRDRKLEKILGELNSL